MIIKKSTMKFIDEDTFRLVKVTIYNSPNNSQILKIEFDQTDNIPDINIILSGIYLYADNDLIRGDYSNFNTLYRQIDDLNYELSISETYVEPEIENIDIEDIDNEDTAMDDEKYQILSQINLLKNEIASEDYKIIKMYEYSLIGSDLEYDIKELHEKRENIRNQIRDLEEKYDKLIN